MNHKVLYHLKDFLDLVFTVETQLFFVVNLKMVRVLIKVEMVDVNLAPDFINSHELVYYEEIHFNVVIWDALEDNVVVVTVVMYKLHN